jgi:hypothetical protein
MYIVKGLIRGRKQQHHHQKNKGNGEWRSHEWREKKLKKRPWLTSRPSSKNETDEMQTERVSYEA